MCKSILNFSTMAAPLQVILTLALLLEVEPHTGLCVDNKCFSVREIMSDFSTANEVCKQSGGNLLTVRSNASDSAISKLLASVEGDFWIGLHSDGNCLQSDSALKGYKWITGQKEDDFHHWENDDAVCPTSPQCVTVSTEGFKWRGRQCTDKVTGFLCEFGFETSCEQLLPDAHSQIQTYLTPFGFESPDLNVLPMASVAKLDDGVQYICVGGWQKSPWSCEFLNGGCMHTCTSVNSKRMCTCAPGYVVDSNGRSCSEAANDPCAQAECQHNCIRQNGNFTCHCNPGFYLDADGKTCKDIDDCADQRICAGAHMRCKNTYGGFECTCEDGFEMQKGICVDIDECFNGPCEHDCINTPGSYNCSCGEGFKISEEDRHRCELHCPYAECPAYCDPNFAFQCKCPWGYILDVRSDGRFCVDINECDMFTCDQHCENSFGSYTCWCGEGYDLLDGYRCVLIESTTSFVTSTTTYTTESPSVTAGGLLGIIICIVCALLAMVLLAYHLMKRQNKHSLIDARKSNDLHDLQQITTEHYKPSFSDTPLKGER